MKATLENVLEKRKSREGARGQEKFGTLPSHKISLDQTIRRLVSKKTRVVEGVREERLLNEAVSRSYGKIILSKAACGLPRSTKSDIWIRIR